MPRVSAALAAASLASALAALTACTQSDGSVALGRVGSPAWMATASPEAKVATYRATCEGYGFQPGTVEMAQCMMHTADGASERAQRASAAASESLRSAGASLQRVPTTTTTDCRRSGDGVTCTTR